MTKMAKGPKVSSDRSPAEVGLVFHGLPDQPLEQAHCLAMLWLFHLPCYHQTFHPSKNTSCHKTGKKGFLEKEGRLL